MEPSSVDPEGLDIRIPFNAWAEQLAKTAAQEVVQKVIEAHKEECEVHDLHKWLKRLDGRVDSLRMRAALLIGILIGSGILGGAAGALVSALVGG